MKILKNIFSLAFKVSRFRFWMYTAGTYVVGYALGMTSWLDFFNLEYFIYLIYFIFPANVFLYGINDYWDLETDKLNPKKEEKEYLVIERDRRKLRLLLSTVIVFSVILLIFQKNILERVIFITFLFLSYFYSAKPLRFKTVPFLDFSSNILYIMPGIFAYIQITGVFPPLLVILAGFLHTSAMHLFSAIPDIEPDKAVGINTTAVFLNKKPSLLLCFSFWSVFSLIFLFYAAFSPLSFLVYFYSGFRILSVLTLLYPALPLALLLKTELNIEKIYWFYPYINTFLGGLLFTLLSISKLYIL